MWLYTLHSGLTQTRLVFDTEIVSIKHSDEKLLFERDQFFSIIKNTVLHRDITI